MAVSPDHRRQGIARALIAELTAKAEENKLAFVTLEVRESNAPAIALYTGAGFAPVGKRKVNAIKMLDYLDEYTDFHFKEEEILQEKAEYPDRGKHHEKHEEFKKTIQELYEYLHDSEGPTDQFSELVHRNVVDWLFGHIKTFDRSVAEFIFMRENPERC